jgi:hypothetical protein
MLYTKDEHDAYQKVRAIKAGQIRYGWVPITARVHPDDAPQVLALIEQVNAARKVELLTAMADADNLPGSKLRLNDHERALLDMLRMNEITSREDVRRFLYARVPSPTMRRVVLSRSLRKLCRLGFVRKLNQHHYALSDRLVAAAA